MLTNDLFKINRTAKRINEGLSKAFGKRIDLESFDLEKLQDARNKLRTQISQIRGQSGFNENLENDAFHQAQWMLDAINSEIAEREEFISDAGTAEIAEESDSVDEIKAKIRELEDEQENNDYGSLAYDTVDAELQFLYSQLDKAEKGVEEGRMSEIDIDLRTLADRGDEEDLIAALEGEMGPNVADVLQNMMEELKDELSSKGMNDVINDQDKMIEMLWDKIVDEYSADHWDDGGDDSRDEGGETDDNYALTSAGFGSDEDYGDFGRDESVQQGDEDTQIREGSAHGYNVVKWYNKNNDQPKLTKWLRTHAGLPKDAPLYFDDADLVYGEETIVPDALVDTKLKFNDLLDAVIDASGSTVPKFQKTPATHYRRPGLEFGSGQGKEFGPWTKESVNTGEDMTRLQEGEIQQASAIVTAKTMVDRVSRWIEELSGMENDTLLQLGDSIRDEMGQEAAKNFISTVAPAIQQALENLKGARETLSTGVRALTGEEQPAEMLGGEPAAAEEEMPAAGADTMNQEPAADEFAAAEPATGGAEAAGREQRESINRQHKLLKVLAG